MRVLHVIDPGSPGGGACTLQMLGELPRRVRSVEQDVLILGSRAHVDLARRCGVNPIGAVATPAGQPLLARGGLANMLATYARAGVHYDVIHAWTVGAAAVAARVAPATPKLATLQVGPVTGLQTHLLLRSLEARPMSLFAGSPAVEAEYRSMGVDPKRLDVLPPAINTDSVPMPEREALRAAWGVRDDMVLVGLLSEPSSWADARAAMDIVIRIAATGRRIALLVHAVATRRQEAERWARRLGYRPALIVTDDVAEPWRIVRGLDVALLMGGGLNSMDLSGAGSPFAFLTGGGRRLRPMPGTMPLLWAMSVGVPVIAEASDAVRGIVEDGRNGMLVEPNDPNAVGDRIIRIHDDPTIAGRLGMEARATVNERFHVSAYAVRVKEAWQRLVESSRPSRESQDEDRKTNTRPTPADGVRHEVAV